MSEAPQAQYDKIGSSYNSVKELSGATAEKLTLLSALGGVNGLSVLDLACGAGHYSRLLASNGVANVLGVDISESMIETARSSTSDSSTSSNATIEYMAKDCSTPHQFGTFDMVLGAWFLNYASSETELAAMFSNISRNLKLGGKFVGLIPPPEVDFAGPWPQCGWTCSILEEFEHAKKCKLTATTNPPVEFECYVWEAGTIEKHAEEAGMGKVKWIKAIIPEEDKELDFWREYVRNPQVKALVAIRER